MAIQTMLAVAAVVTSLAALAVSSIISWRQLRSMRSANHLPVAIEMLTRDYGKPEFQQNERHMLQALADIDPAGGVSGLPEPLLSASLQVIAFYDSIGIMVAFGCIDEELVLTSINFRIRRIWRVLEPFIQAERDIRGGPFLDFLEDLAVRAHSKDPRHLSANMGLKKMPSGPPPQQLGGRSTSPEPVSPRCAVEAPDAVLADPVDQPTPADQGAREDNEGITPTP